MKICIICGDELTWSDSADPKSLGKYVHATQNKDHEALIKGSKNRPGKWAYGVESASDIGRWESEGGHLD